MQLVQRVFHRRRPEEREPLLRASLKAGQPRSYLSLIKTDMALSNRFENRLMDSNGVTKTVPGLKRITSFFKNLSQRISSVVTASRAFLRRSNPSEKEQSAMAASLLRHFNYLHYLKDSQKVGPEEMRALIDETFKDMSQDILHSGVLCSSEQWTNRMQAVQELIQAEDFQDRGAGHGSTSVSADPDGVTTCLRVEGRNLMGDDSDEGLEFKRSFNEDKDDAPILAPYGIDAFLHEFSQSVAKAMAENLSKQESVQRLNNRAMAFGSAMPTISAAGPIAASSPHQTSAEELVTGAGNNDESAKPPSTPMVLEPGKMTVKDLEAVMAVGRSFVNLSTAPDLSPTLGFSDWQAYGPAEPNTYEGLRNVLIEQLGGQAFWDGLNRCYRKSETRDAGINFQRLDNVLKSFLLNEIDKIGPNMAYIFHVLANSEMGFIPEGEAFDTMRQACAYFCDPGHAVHLGKKNEQIQGFLHKLKEYAKVVETEGFSATPLGIAMLAGLTGTTVCMVNNGQARKYYHLERSQLVYRDDTLVTARQGIVVLADDSGLRAGKPIVNSSLV